MKSIKLKLVVIYLALVFIVMIVSGTFMLGRIRNQEKTKLQEDLVSFSSIINEQVIQLYEDSDFQDGINTFYSDSQDSNSVHSFILRDDGQAIASTDKGDNESYKYPQFQDTAVISAASGVPSFGIGPAPDTNGIPREWIHYAEKVEKEGTDASYIIYTRTETKPMYARVTEIGVTFFFTVVLALILTGVLGFLFANTLTGPIIALTKKAKDMAQGDLNQEIPVYGTDEIGQLSETFNHMALELNRFMGTMESEKNKMEAILHNMTDGVLAYDSEGVLIHANISCHDMLNFKDLEEIPFGQMMEILGSDIRNINDLSPENLKESIVSIGDKFISASFTSYSNIYRKTIGIVIVLQDITKHKKLDNMRKEFVANVSHEIRTPLTTIKSYTETLLDGAIDDKNTATEFLNVIESETDRMTFLAEDLLELSRFDNKQTMLDLKIVNIIEILRQSIKQNSLSAEKDSQTIVMDSKYTDFWVMADAARVNQVFTNIISNAIKYGREGAIVEILLEETEKYYRVYIKDSGVGIPKEDLNRIFERFYRVDKARSRAMGGTGLGLAIAKEIMDAHGGKIFATSEVGVGTTMVLRFKKQGLKASKEV